MKTFIQKVKIFPFTTWLLGTIISFTTNVFYLYSNAASLATNESLSRIVIELHFEPYFFNVKDVNYVNDYGLMKPISVFTLQDFVEYFFSYKIENPLNCILCCSDNSICVLMNTLRHVLFWFERKFRL